MHTKANARRRTKEEKRAWLEEFLNNRSDDELAEMLEAAFQLAVEAMEQVERRDGMTVGEIVVDRLRHRGHEDDILYLPLRGRHVLNWLPPIYYVWYVAFQPACSLPVAVSWLGDIPLDAKLSIGQSMYEDVPPHAKPRCPKLDELAGWEPRLDGDREMNERVAKLLLEAQLDMVKVSAASIAARGLNKDLTREQRIKGLMGLFEMLIGPRRRRRC
jgi:hypothetical protein